MGCGCRSPSCCLCRAQAHNRPAWEIGVLSFVLLVRRGGGLESPPGPLLLPGSRDGSHNLRAVGHGIQTAVCLPNFPINVNECDIGSTTASEIVVGRLRVDKEVDGNSH